MAKSFKTAPVPSRPTKAQMDAFVNGAGSADTQTPAAPPTDASTQAEKEKPARLSLDMPADLHTRFKAACARSRKKMTTELLTLIERRTVELEEIHN